MQEDRGEKIHSLHFSKIKLKVHQTQNIRTRKLMLRYVKVLVPTDSKTMFPG